MRSYFIFRSAALIPQVPESLQRPQEPRPGILEGGSCPPLPIFPPGLFLQGSGEGCDRDKASFLLASLTSSTIPD